MTDVPWNPSSPPSLEARLSGLESKAIEKAASQMEVKSYADGHVAAWRASAGPVGGMVTDYRQKLSPLDPATTSAGTLKRSVVGGLRASVIGPMALLRAKVLGVKTDFDPIVRELDRVMAGVGYDRQHEGGRDMVKFFSGPGEGTGTGGLGYDIVDVLDKTKQPTLELHALLVAGDVEQEMEFHYEVGYPELGGLDYPYTLPAPFKVKLAPGVSAVVMSLLGAGFTFDENTFRLCHRLEARGEGCAFMLSYKSRDGSVHPDFARDLARAVRP